MPELPEVQTIVDDLKKRVVGRKIIKFWTNTPKLVKSYDPQKFSKDVLGMKITGIGRRGKNILFYLIKRNKKYILLAHQKMTGHFLIGKWKVSGKQDPIFDGNGEIKTDFRNKFIRAIFYLDNRKMLGLSDVRKFAKLVLGEKEKIENLPELKKMGPDALSEDFNWKYFKNKTRNTKRNIKQVLLDQNIVAGIGNIYADESLFLANINPRVKVSLLKNNQGEKLIESIKKVLKKAIGLRGTSIIDFRDTFGKKGGYDKVRWVYGRYKLPCRVCGTKIERIKIGQRSSHFCPNCQKYSKISV